MWESKDNHPNRRSRFALSLAGLIALLALGLILSSAAAAIRAPIEAELQDLEKIAIQSEDVAGLQEWPSEAAMSQYLKSLNSYTFEVADFEEDSSSTITIEPESRDVHGDQLACSRQWDQARGG